MANTSIQLKKSGSTGNTPVNLAYGELAINYADGKLYYKNNLDSIDSIENQDVFSTVIANGTPVIATNKTDIIAIDPGTGISIGADGVNKQLTISVNESQLTTFVKKTGDTMTGDLRVDTANVYANELVVNNTLYSGLAARTAVQLPDLLAQFASNSASYVQVNIQNINSDGSGDFVVTSDVGTDTDFFIDMGINNSNFNNPEQTSQYPLDGYLIVQGSTINQEGGNLVIGTSGTLSKLNTKIVAGGLYSENVVAEFGQSGVQIYNDLNVDGTITGPTINSIITLAQGAFNKANTSDQANVAFDRANAAYNQANTGTTLAQNAYNFANTIPGSNFSANSLTSNTQISVRNSGSVRYYDLDSTNYVGFKAPSAVAFNLLWTLPGTDGSSAQVLSTDGAGTLYWQTTGEVGGGGGYFNSTITAFPGSLENYDYGAGELYVGESATLDAFGVGLIATFSCMDPLGRLEAVDLGAL